MGLGCCAPFSATAGVQLTLGTFVATFLYAILTLGSVSDGHPDFVPHVSITVCLALTLLDLGVLVDFIHHVARSIQLPEVIAGIGELSAAITAEFSGSGRTRAPLGASGNLPTLLAADGTPIAATTSGYLQFLRYTTLIDVAVESDSVIELLHRPGHFLFRGLPLTCVCRLRHPRWHGDSSARTSRYEQLTDRTSTPRVTTASEHRGDRRRRGASLRTVMNVCEQARR